MNTATQSINKNKFIINIIIYLRLTHNYHRKKLRPLNTYLVSIDFYHLLHNEKTQKQQHILTLNIMTLLLLR